MKRIFLLLIIPILLAGAVFAQSTGDEQGDFYDDGYVYEQNGAGDRFLKIDLGATIPLNFGKQLYPGIGAGISFFRFLNGNIALGGQISVAYNLSIGKKSLITVPITAGIMYQPYIKKFEFPMMLTVGMASSSCQNQTYFPSLAVRAEAGAYYRFSDMWSFGLNASGLYISQWFPKSSTASSDQGLFMTASLCARYHF